MTAAEVVTAYERNLITEAEAVEQAMVDDVIGLYRKAVIQLAPHLSARTVEPRPLPC